MNALIRNMKRNRNLVLSIVFFEILGWPVMAAAGECYVGTKAQCQNESGHVGVKECIKGEDYPQTYICEILYDDWFGYPEPIPYCADGCSPPCLCPVDNLCERARCDGCSGETFDAVNGSCDEPPFGIWDECEVEPECEEKAGNPINLNTGNVDFTPSRPDGEFWDRQGRFTFGRRYSSDRHIGDIIGTVTFGPLSGPAFLTPGWTHDFQYELLEYEDVAGSSLYSYRPPDAHHFYGVSCSGVSCLNTTDKYKFTLLDDQFKVEHLDGTMVLFKRLDGDEGLTTSLSSTFRYVPVEVTRPDGANYTLTYYGLTSTGDCYSRDPPYQGQLCRIDGNGGGYIQVERYLLPTKDGDPANLPPYATRVRYGVNNGSVDDEYGRLQYSFWIYERRKPNGALSNRYGAKLTGVELHKLVAPDTYELIERNRYLYSDHAYYRPDLGSETLEDGATVSNPYTEWKPIILHDGYGVQLLERAYNSSGELISGHYYDEHGRGAASFRPGEYLRVVYVDDYAPDERRVLVVNESKGTQAEYAIRDGVLDQISGGIACGKTTESIQYGDYWKATRSVSPDGVTPGVWSVIGRDSKERTLVSLENWDDFGSIPRTAAEAPGVVSRDDLISRPTRLRTFEYSPDHLDVPAKDSLVYSVLCPDAETFGYACNGAAAEPYTMRTFDPASKDVLTETQVGMGVDPDTGGVVTMTREDSFVYDAEGRLVEAHDALGRGTRFTDYQSAGEADPCAQLGGTSGGEHNIGRVKTVELLSSGTLIEQRGNYDATGNPGCTIDENGVATFLWYNDFGQVVERRTDSEGNQRRERYAYRADGKLIVSSVGKLVGGSWSSTDVATTNTVWISESMGAGYSCWNSSGFSVDTRPGFTGTSGGWVRAEATVDAGTLSAAFQVRFAYGAGVAGRTTNPETSRSYTAAGWFVDDVRFERR